MTELADGRIYTGKQALKFGLIDELGGQDEALNWLQTEKKIEDKLEIEEISVIKPENNLSQLLFGSKASLSILDELNLKGLLAIWSPEIK